MGRAAAEEGEQEMAQAKRGILSRFPELRMKAASKRVKRVDEDSESSSGAESDPQSEMELDPARWKMDDDDDDDASESFSEGESDQESEMEGEDEGSDPEHIEGRRDAQMDELEKQYRSLRNEEQ
ncbi:hypothetical protein COCNU_scaffold147833G000020 [Cocos nucifera]|nr:hypothetical protein [Cocos nucifera]